MNKKLNFPNYVLLSLLLSAIIFLVSVNISRTFKSEILLLVLPENSQSEENSDQMLANIKEFPFSLSFYEKLIENNLEIEDQYQEMPPYKKKLYWEDKLKTQRIGESSIIRFEVFDDSRIDAELLSQKIVSETIKVASKYYKIEKEVRFRIIDGPIIFETPKGSLIHFAIQSSVWGFLCLGIVFLILKFITARKKPFQDHPTSKFLKNYLSGLKPAFPDFKPEISAKKETVKEAPEKAIRKTEVKEEKRITPERKSSAPANLPSQEQDVPDIFKKYSQSSTIKERGPEKIIPQKQLGNYQEATPEEVKERLNKLLSGKLG